jgi:hypothetical protein
MSVLLVDMTSCNNLYSKGECRDPNIYLVIRDPPKPVYDKVHIIPLYHNRNNQLTTGEFFRQVSKNPKQMCQNSACKKNMAS